jgi:hypothetical protein
MEIMRANLTPQRPKSSGCAGVRRVDLRIPGSSQKHTLSGAHRSTAMCVETCEDQGNEC